jgi:hypothetical protein
VRFAPVIVRQIDPERDVPRRGVIFFSSRPGALDHPRIREGIDRWRTLVWHLREVVESAGVKATLRTDDEADQKPSPFAKFFASFKGAFLQSRSDAGKCARCHKS